MITSQAMEWHDLLPSPTISNCTLTTLTTGVYSTYTHFKLRGILPRPLVDVYVASSVPKHPVQTVSPCLCSLPMGKRNGPQKAF